MATAMKTKDVQLPTASDIMITRVEAFAPETEIAAAVETLLGRGYSGAPVVDAQGRPLGVLSEHDCVRVLASALYEGWPTGTVADHMTKGCETIDEHADLLAFETMPDALELDALAELLAHVPGPPAWISLSLAPDRLALADGSALEAAIAPLREHPRVFAIGVNCLAPARVEAALLALRACTELPLVAYPNSGECWAASERDWAGAAVEHERFAALARRWIDAGARLIGGCCRTGPEHLRALARLR